MLQRRTEKICNARWGNDCAAVVKDQKMNLIAKQVSKALGHIGNLDVDLFVVEDKIYLLEMNARLGGGIRLVI